MLSICAVITNITNAENNCNLCPSFKVRDHISQPYKLDVKRIILYIGILTFSTLQVGRIMHF
jgi:hypothetical protein